MPKPDSSLSAVVVSGGKQYRVAPGDQILVDRLAAEPGSSLKLDRVLLVHNGDEITVAVAEKNFDSWVSAGPTARSTAGNTED